MNESFYVTTSIPYVNAAPHVGHALEFVLSDVFARYHRLLGHDTRFLTGTDDNSLKNVLAAEREGVPVCELVDRNASAFRELAALLNLSHDDFIRTSSDRRHIEGVRALWEALDRHGDIYKRSYEGLYCVGCEQFYTEEELVDGLCPDHASRPELVREENYFFRLSRYRAQLAELLDSGRLRISPTSRRNEVRAFIQRGLEDFSVSRTRARARGWGIAVPGDPDQVMYVWFDALANYITALGYGTTGDLYRRYWIENPRRVHVIGKGILRFHAVFWPAMLLAADEPLPTTILVHGYLTIAGQKVSKSLGNGVDPAVLVRRYGVDPLRYWLLREVAPTEDADYTDERLERRSNADLADDLGNLLNRTLSMLDRYRNRHIPAPAEPAPSDVDLEAIASGAIARVHTALGEAFDSQAALIAIWELVARANRYVEQMAPWSLARAERAGDVRAGRRLDTVLYYLAESLRLLAEALRPFLPATSQRLAAQLGVALAASSWVEALSWGGLDAGTTVQAAQPIFAKYGGLARAGATRDA